MYHLQVVTPEEVIYDDDVIALIASGEDGYLGILTNHAPILVALKKGILILTDKNKKKLYFNTSKGFLEVNHNKASIILETIEPRAPVDIGIQGGI